MGSTFSNAAADAEFVCLVLGIWIFIRAYRPPRIGNTPHCPHCDYIISGLDTERCSECGGEVSPATLVRGERHRRRGKAVLGLLMILLPTMIFFVDAIGRLEAVNWYHYRPARWVIRDFDSASPVEQAKAWTELQDRLRAGGLAAARLDDLIERALKKQQGQGPTPSFFTEMMDFLGTQYLDHHLSSAQAERFFASAMKLQLEVRTPVGVGDRIPYEISRVGRGPSNGWWMRDTDAGFWIDGTKMSQGTSSGTGGFSGVRIGGTLEPAAVGKHHLRISKIVGASTGAFESSQGPLDHPRTIVLDADFEVISALPPLAATTVPAPAILQSCLSAKLHASLSKSFGGEIDVVNPPVDLAFDVFARVEGREYAMGSVTFRKSNSSNAGYGISTATLPPRALRQIDIVLRSSEKAARGTVDLHQYWKGEIVIPNVKVERRGP